MGNYKATMTGSNVSVMTGVRQGSVLEYIFFSFISMIYHKD